MSNHPKPGSTSTPIAERHGRKGHVTLVTTVPPELKDHLVEYCAACVPPITLKAAIECALREFLYEP